VRKGVEREQVGLGGLEQIGDLRRGPGELFDDLAEPLMCLVAVGGVEELTDRARDQRLLSLRDVAEHVAREVHGAALPRAAEHLADRGAQPLVAV
jgi:hypothetical protein